MKTFLTTALAILLFTITSRAQNTFPATGNVGIGTTAPAGKLQVQNGSWDLLTSASSLDIGVGGNSGGWARALRVVNTSGSNGADGGAFGVFGNSSTPNYVYMAIPTATTSPIGYNSTNILVLDNFGNVGIGTTNPGLKAHIIGTMGFPATSGAAQTGILRLQGTGNSSVLDFSVNGGMGAALQATSGANLALNYPLLLNPNGGNVGIGTVTPGSHLHLYENNLGNNGATGITVEQGGAGNALLQFLQTGVQRWTMGIDHSTAGAQSFKIATGVGLGTADKFTILPSGNVGIGTAAPDAQLALSKADNSIYNLHITNAGASAKGMLISGGNAGSDATLLQVTNFANTSNFFTVTDGNSYFENGNVGIGTTAPDAQLTMIKADNTNYNLHITNAGGTAKGVLISGGSASSDATLLRVTNSANTSNFFTVTDGNSYFENGKVGIGTTSPDQKLTVNGTIHSSEVIVDTNIPTPDYVFDKTYDLPTLTSVKTYIDKNHHLSEIPSAAEVDKNGQRVGEMNMLLLKKVEELTLYMIEKDKQVKALEQQQEIMKQQKEALQQQQTQINQLKKQVEELINAKK